MPTRRRGRSARSSRRNEEGSASAFTFPISQMYSNPSQQYAFGVQGSPQPIYPAYTFAQPASPFTFGQPANPYAFGSRVQFPVNPVGSIGTTYHPGNYNRRRGQVDPVGPGAPNFEGYLRNADRRRQNPLNVAGQAARWRNTYMKGGKKRKNKTRRKSI
jgi:hypothetical protein